jgi:hypothetical protein
MSTKDLYINRFNSQWSQCHSIYWGGGDVNADDKLVIGTMPMTLTHITTVHLEVTA